ncbi:RecQ family ATP-dependent DNA helicase [Segatella bryantii]|jgi:ATP-dependent DNA helicase RecQ|uniref:RecQ family ATP-dependent DNA helicase n=1 Tax=Segatella bryantii TaxID=77095 RepID=UPI0024306450|nr:ATP-dependent DNA helicase RecQ [Segatella bryantii]
MDYLKILHQYWGYPDFRGIQREIIESIGKSQDTLGLMPTGGGKSITFQVPALAKDGVCIVITPLIALMKDQVAHLKDKGILADAIYSGKNHSEIIQILENCIFGRTKFLYVSPERLSTELFQTKLKHIKVSFITVDEAHCISQWGYDFRPSYLKIADIRKMKPGVPILALTATATPEVIDDIQEKLDFKHKNVFRMSFERKNLAYVVRKTADKYGELIHILSSVPGCGIVYVRSRKRCKEIASMLNDSGISSTFYHAGLDPIIKDERQKAWQNNEKRIIVATNAFGMGIDKPDVRIVVHIDCPDSLEAYFQEAGRGGRDGQKAYAVLLYNDNDKLKLHKRVIDTFPEKDYIRNIYEHLAYFYQIGVGSGYGNTFEFHIDKFSYTYKFFPIPVNSSLHILDRCGYIHYEDNPDSKARLRFMLGRNDLYQLNSLSANEELIITELLRDYGGLFTDYVYIDEFLIAQKTNIPLENIYLILKNLSARHIINFIPRRKMPYITYLRDREDGINIKIPSSVYENRKEQFVKRIEAMINYAENDYVCRSRQLLLYFGEDNNHDCEQCDVCLTHHTQTSQKDIEQAKKDILQYLSDKETHLITELKTLNLPEKIFDEALESLILENQVFIEYSEIRIA